MRIQSKYATNKSHSQKRTSIGNLGSKDQNSRTVAALNQLGKSSKDTDTVLSKNSTGPQYIVDSGQLDFQKMRQMVSSHNEVIQRNQKI